MADEGYVGQWRPKVIDGGSLMDLQKIAGMAPHENAHWVMVDLATGQLKWYQSRRGRTGGNYNRRPYRAPWRRY